MSESETPDTNGNASRGTIWAAADFWVQQTSQLLTFILVGNILGPHVVGVITMALVTTLFLAALLENGFADALIQRAELADEHFDSTFWLMLGLGTLLGFLQWAATPLMALLFSESQLNDILPLMAIGLPCIAITACYTSLLRRQLKFRQLATRSVLAYCCGFLAAVAMAKLGYGIYSLVAFFLVSRVLDTVLIIAVSGLWPGIRVTRKALGEIIGFGKHRVGHQLVSYISTSMDRFVIGVFLGPVALGLYAVAGRLVAALNNGISGVFQRVAFPVLASRQADSDAFERSMQDFLTVVNLLSLPAFAGLALTSHGLIDVLFSPSWEPAAPLMQILCIAALAAPTNYILTAATNALGRPGLVLNISLVVLALRVAASLWAAQIGVLSVAIANAAVYLISVPIFLVVANNLFRGKWPRLFSGTWAPSVATALMAAAVLAISPALSAMNEIFALACQIAVGIATYAISIRLLAPQLYKKAIETVNRRR